jgi:acyl-lipid omega-6 desaturase (Delta-12 desaturase)
VANDAVGFVLGVFTLTPYHQWRLNHALHHATACNLDRRGHGDIRLLTVGEYVRLNPFRRLCYRVLHNPWFLFGVAPLFHFVVLQRIPYYSRWSWKKSSLEVARGWVRERRGVHATNALIVAVVALAGHALGWSTFLAVQLPAAALAASAGMWLFHVQHAFDGARWTPEAGWDYVSTGTLGSSYYKLPRVLQWLTANIGLHHVHHLDSRIPYYRLPASLVAVPELRDAPALTLRASGRCAWLSLWDERTARLVGFRDLGGSGGAKGVRFGAP